jgi:sugar phosphate isomerase/epimerase
VLGYHTIHHSPMFGGRASVLDVIDATAAAGFDCIGFDQPAVEAELMTGTPIEAIVDAVRRHELAVSDVVVLALRPAEDTEPMARRLAELATSLGAPRCVVGVPEAMPAADLVAALATAASVLGDHGVTAALEFTPYSALATLEAAADLCAAVGWDRAGLVLDSLHVHRTGTTMARLRALRPDQVALVQWSDGPSAAPADLVAESRHGRLVPGEGDLPLVAMAGVLKAVGYDGPVVAEVLAEDLRVADPAGAALAVHAAMVDHWRS